MDITRHPLFKAIYDLCLEIETLPAAEHQTKLVTMASDLKKPAELLYSQWQDSSVTLPKETGERITLDWSGESGDGKRAFIGIKESDEFCIELDTDDCDKEEVKRIMQIVIDRNNSFQKLVGALERITNYPVHSEPIGSALDMQDIAAEALKS